MENRKLHLHYAHEGEETAFAAVIKNDNVKKVKETAVNSFPTTENLPRAISGDKWALFGFLYLRPINKLLC